MSGSFHTFGVDVLRANFLLLAIFASLCTAQGAASGVRVGTLTVRVTASCEGTEGGSITDPTGSASWSESYQWNLRSEAQYEVVQINSRLFGLGKELSGSSAETISGNGTAKGGPSSSSWTYESNPDFDPTQSFVFVSLAMYTTNTGSVSAGLPFYIPRTVYTIDPPDASATGGAASAALEALAQAKKSFQFELPKGVVSWGFSQTGSGSVEWNSPFGSAQGAANISAQVQFQPEGRPEWEAIIVPNPPEAGAGAYKDWLPVGGTNENHAGGAIYAKVYLRAKDGSAAIPPRAKYTFLLKDVSREPGICMNYPFRSKPAYLGGGDPEPDLKIGPASTLDVSENGQEASTKGFVAEVRLGILCYDYGAYGKLKVTAETEDEGQMLVARVEHPDQDFLSIPLDENQNKIGDAWEIENDVMDRSMPPGSDLTANEMYAGQHSDGDGISVYEKYRGFYVLRGQFAMQGEEHERLDPLLKHLFVRNPDGLLRSTFDSADGNPVSYPALSKVEIHYLGPAGWTGFGTYGDHARIVNFNRLEDDKHVGDQHGILVSVSTAKNPLTSWDYNEVRTRTGRAETNYNHSGDFGIAYPDFTAPTGWRPARTLEVNVFLVNIRTFVEKTVQWHAAGWCAPPCDLATFAQGLIQSRMDEYRKKLTIELSATLAHEIGHATGINHHKPTDSDFKDAALRNCTMRYYSYTEFTAETSGRALFESDLFELIERGYNPSEFCRSKFNCWSQLRVSDQGGAARAASTHARPESYPEILRSASIPIITNQPPQLLDLSADLPWSDLVEGDPVRAVVRLHGLTDMAQANWADGVRINLYALREDGGRNLILDSNAWKHFTQPLWFDTLELGFGNATRMREWIAPPEAANLSPGRFMLEVSFDGRGLASNMVLPPSGILTMAPMEFAVQPATNDTVLARHKRHLAHWRYLGDDHVRALEHAQEAIRLDPDATNLPAVQNQLIATHSALLSAQYLTAAEISRQLAERLPDENMHAGSVAATQWKLLAPEMRIGVDSSGEGKLAIGALPTGTYVLETSSDLMSWTAFSTNTPNQSSFETPIGPPGGELRNFYRIRWIR